MVDPHRQHLLSMDGTDAIHRSLERLLHRPSCEDAITFATKQPSRGGVNECDTRRRRIVEDHETIGHSARFAEALMPVARALQHAHAYHDVEAARFELQ